MGIPIISLFALREAHGWTQAEVARRCGICTATYRRIETGRGNPSPPTFTALARVFHLSQAALKEATA
jgi:transcriptional regulator with XRE-family HTH domain